MTCWFGVVLCLALVGCGTGSNRVSDTDPTGLLSVPPQDSGPFPSPRPQTIIVVLVDALRPDYVGAYGSDKGLTPELDRVADESIVFESAHATSAWTRSSVASLFTSRYPTSHTVLDLDDALPSRAVTLAEVVGIYEETRSFGVIANAANTGAEIGFAQGFQQFMPPPSAPRRGYEGDIEAAKLIPAEAITERALDLFADGREAAVGLTFAYLHYVDPHDPYMANPGLLDSPEPEGRFSGSRRDLTAIQQIGRDELTDEDVARLEYLYQGEIRFFDVWFGKLIAGLRELGIYDEALLVVTADHGEAFWEHGFRGHGQSLHETQLHVPLLIKLPGMQPGDGRRVSTAVSLVDVAPTVLHALGIPRPSEFQGHSLAPLISGQERPESLKHIFSELYLDERMIRTSLLFQGHKLIKMAPASAPDGDVLYEFYDLTNDPGEKVNRIDDPGLAEEIERLTLALMGWEHYVASQALEGQAKGVGELSPETIEALRALGYIR